MTNPRRVTLAIVLAGVSLAVGAVVLKLRDNREFSNPALQLSRFPFDSAVVASIDFTAMRQIALPGPAKVAPEPEYRAFLDGTGFDYRKDVDHIYASISPGGNFFVVQGRFDWNRLSAYARQQGGSCYQSLCRMQGSTPQRRISFLPLRDDMMALAVSTDDLAATRLSKPGTPVTISIPTAPAWVSIGSTALRQPSLVPPGLRVMMSGLQSAERVLLTVSGSGKGIEIRMDASCPNKADAGLLTSEFRNTARVIREGMTQKQLATDDELAVMLAAGKFEQQGTHVSGRWPVAKTFLESMLDGL
jgi:hypothetical protein